MQNAFVRCCMATSVSVGHTSGIDRSSSSACLGFSATPFYAKDDARSRGAVRENNALLDCPDSEENTEDDNDNSGDLMKTVHPSAP